LESDISNDKRLRPLSCRSRPQESHRTKPRNGKSGCARWRGSAVACRIKISQLRAAKVWLRVWY